jgi:peroxiredoxin
MKRLHVVSLMIAAALAVAAFAGGGNARATDFDVPTPPAIGATVVDFTLPDANGTNHSLASLSGKNGTVLIFIATQCPISNAYNERMEKLAQEYKARGINVVGINANSTESAADVKAHAAEKHLTFTILKDDGNKIADALGATRTPEAYLLDAKNKLVYHGRIDNSRDETQVVSSELREAIDETLAGKPVAKTTANAFGCSIKRG